MRRRQSTNTKMSISTAPHSGVYTQSLTVPLCACSNETILSDYTYIPSVVFSSPHVAKVGLDEAGAVEQYKNVNIFCTTFRYDTYLLLETCMLLVPCQPHSNIATKAK